MKAADTLRRAGKSLRQAKIRTLLTSLAIAVGAFTIMISLAAGQGARDYANQLIQSNVDPNALFIVKDESIVGGGGGARAGLSEYGSDTGATPNGQSITVLTQDDIDSLKQREDITDVRPIYDTSAEYVSFEGIDTKYTASLSVYNPDVLSEVDTGTLPALGNDLAADEVAVPNSFADELGVSAEDLVGKTLTLTVTQATVTPSQDQISQAFASGGVEAVKALTQPKSKQITLNIVATVKPSNLSFSGSSAILIPISVAEDIAEYTTKGTEQYQKYFAVTAKAAPGHTPESVKEALTGEGYFPQTANDLQGFLFTIVNVLQGIVAGFGVIALLASVFGIINTQYISVLERTSQIGLMRALGMRGRDVSRLFRYEAAWIGFLGGVIGIATAWIVCTSLNPWISEQLDLGEGIYLLQFEWLQALGLLAALIVIAVAAGYFPSRKAAKLDPIEALRTE